MLGCFVMVSASVDAAMLEVSSRERGSEHLAARHADSAWGTSFDDRRAVVRVCGCLGVGIMLSGMCVLTYALVKAPTACAGMVVTAGRNLVTQAQGQAIGSWRWENRADGCTDIYNHIYKIDEGFYDAVHNEIAGTARAFIERGEVFLTTAFDPVQIPDIAQKICESAEHWDKFKISVLKSKRFGQQFQGKAKLPSACDTGTAVSLIQEMSEKFHQGWDRQPSEVIPGIMEIIHHSGEQEKELRSLLYKVAEEVRERYAPGKPPKDNEKIEEEIETLKESVNTLKGRSGKMRDLLIGEFVETQKRRCIPAVLVTDLYVGVNAVDKGKCANKKELRTMFIRVQTSRVTESEVRAADGTVVGVGSDPMSKMVSWFKNVGCTLM